MRSALGMLSAERSVWATIACTPDEHWVSFMRSFPNKLPLSAAVVEKVASRVLELDFDRLYDNFAGRVAGDAGPGGHQRLAGGGAPHQVAGLRQLVRPYRPRRR